MTHDQNFHNLIVDYPRSAVEFFAAEEAEGITSDARVIPVGEEQLKDRLGDRFHEVDAPMLLEWPDGKRKAIVFLFEEETEPRVFSIHRLGRYCLQLGELLEMDRVVPVAKLHTLLKKADPASGFGGLERVQDKRRQFLWVHPRYTDQY